MMTPRALHDASEIVQLFAEPARLRLLALLAAHELAVGELVDVTGLAQSRVSTHLARLKEAGMLRDRRVGSSSFYRLSDPVPELPGRIWGLLERDLADALIAQDAARAAELVRARADEGRWPDRVAGEMERHYSPGRTWEATCRAFAGMLRLGHVLDVGSGDGTIAELLAPRAASVTCVDVSARVIGAAQRRLARLPHIRCVCADMHALPVRSGVFDQVLLFNALACASDPRQALCEAARALRPAGQLLVVTLDQHAQMDVAASYGHVQPGFSPLALRALLAHAGLRVTACDISTRERQSPRFVVVTAFAEKPSAQPAAEMRTP
jgi:DNA-binding transcriptional ArsR family regulator/protein-L-isoaspartate O-methyltransferase